jgi:hypothetical protein
MTPQSGNTIRGPSTVTEGGTLTVEVGAGVTTVYVGPVGGSAGLVPYPVGPDGRASIPVAAVPPGTILWVATGKKGRHVHVILVEVIGLD